MGGGLCSFVGVGEREKVLNLQSQSLVLYSGPWKDSVKGWLIQDGLVEFVGPFAVSAVAHVTSCSRS